MSQETTKEKITIREQIAKYTPVDNYAGYVLDIILKVIDERIRLLREWKPKEEEHRDARIYELKKLKEELLK